MDWHSPITPTKKWLALLRAISCLRSRRVYVRQIWQYVRTAHHAVLWLKLKFVVSNIPVFGAQEIVLQTFRLLDTGRSFSREIITISFLSDMTILNRRAPWNITRYHSSVPFDLVRRDGKTVASKRLWHVHITLLCTYIKIKSKHTMEIQITPFARHTHTHSDMAWIVVVVVCWCSTDIGKGGVQYQMESNKQTTHIEEITTTVVE